MKGKLSVKKSNGASLDQTALLSLPLEQLQKRKQSQAGQQEFDELIFETINENQETFVINILKTYGEIHPPKTIQFKNCELSENLMLQLVDIILSGKYKIKSINSSDNNQNNKLNKALLTKLTTGNTINVTVSIGGFSTTISKINTSHYSKEFRIKCIFELNDFASWSLHKEELELLIENQGSFNEVSFSFASLSSTQENELVNWLTLICTKASFDVTVRNKKSLEEKLKKINSRNSFCSINREKKSFSFSQEVNYYVETPSCYLLDEPDIRYLSKLFSRNAGITSVEFSDCDTDSKNWENIFKAVNQLKNLTFLNFSNIKLDVDRARIFAEELRKCTMLTKFSLSHIGLPPGGILTIIQSMCAIESLSEVELGNIIFAIGDIKAISKLPGLRLLKLPESLVSDEALYEFVNFFEHPWIEKIDMGDTRFRAENLFLMISASLSFPTCQFIFYVDHYSFFLDSYEKRGRDNIQRLLNATNKRNHLMQKLKKSEEVISILDFNSLQFSDICIPIVCDYVRAHPEVEKLLLQSNNLTVNGFAQLAEGLYAEAKLTLIDLSHSKEKPSCNALEKLLTSLRYLSNLHLFGSKIDYENLFERLIQSDAFPSAKIALIEETVQQSLPQTQLWGGHHGGYSRQEESKQAKEENELRALQNKFDRLTTRNQRILRLKQKDQVDEDSPSPSLTELNFDDIYLNDTSLPTLCEYIEQHPDVRKLSATNNSLTPVGVRFLCDTLTRATHVVSVNFSRTRDSKEWLDYLVDGCIKFPHITHLVLYDTNPSKDQIIRCVSQSKVEKLEVSSVHGVFEWFRDSTDLFTAEIITRNPEKDPQFVRVRNRNIKLRQFLELKMLSETKLDLSEAAITHPLVPIICEALNRNPQVRELSLAGNGIDDQSMALLLEAIAKHSNIRSLNISRNHIGEASVLLLKNYLIATTKLHYLQAENLGISDKGVIYLCEALGENHSLISVNLSHNTHVLSSLDTVGKYLRKNKTLLELICLDDPKELDSYPLIKEQYDKTPNTKDKKEEKANLKVHKEHLEEEIKRRRLSLNKFFEVLSAAPKKTSNKTLVKCVLYHQNLFSSDFNFKIQNKGVTETKLSDFLKENLDRAKECHVSLEKILGGADQKELDKFEKLIDLGVSLYFAHSQNRTFLHMAASAGNDRVVSVVLRKMASFDVEFFDDNSESPVHIAEISGHKKVVELLKNTKTAGMPNASAAKEPETKKAKPNPPTAAESSNAKQAEDGESFLPSLSTIGAPSPAKKAKVDDAPAADEQFALKLDDWQIIQAISSENIMGLNFCINQNAALMTAQINGQTLLHLAVACKKPRVVELLVEKGAIVNALNQEGRPALFSLLDECLHSRKCSVDCLLIAKILLENTAAILHQGEHALHLAVRAGIVRLVKLLMRFDGDVNAKVVSIDDSNNHTALTWAVLTRNLEILQILLLSPDLEKGTVEIALQCAETWKSSSAFIELLKTRLQSPFLDRKQNTHWLKDMKICFGASSVHNTLFIESHEQQMRLMLQNKFSSSILRSRKKIKSDEENLEKEEEGNPVTVSFTFIVSTRKHLSQSHNVRDCITITLDPNVSLSAEHHITKGDAEQTFNTDEIRQSVQARTKRGEELSKKDISERKHKPSEEIVDETRLEKRSFEALFHHGEQSLAAALEQKQVLDYLIRQLLAHPQFTTGCKLYGVVLDIHSPRYVCSNCEIGILSIQHPASSPFLNNLAEGLKQLGCILPLLSPLRMVTRIGSYQAFERDTITPEEQLNICLDLRLLGNKIILQQDLVVSANPTMQFNSRVNE